MRLKSILICALASAFTDPCVICLLKKDAALQNMTNFV